MGKVEIFKIILGVEKMCRVEEENSLNPWSLPAGKEKKKSDPGIWISDECVTARRRLLNWWRQVFPFSFPLTDQTETDTHNTAFAVSKAINSE